MDKQTLSDERIDHIADIVIRGMPDGVRGFCISWGYRQFARALLEACDGYTREVSKPILCACKDRPASECEEEWGPKCDLGNNPRFARASRPQE